jgi:uncharacterized membrane protein YbhN (UPF0104 family)
LTVLPLLALVAVRQFMRQGWPLTEANVLLVTTAGALFLFAAIVKASAWQLLFAHGERPSRLALTVAGGAATVTGVALPARFDTAVRIGVVRRYRGAGTGLGAVCVSLGLLGLVDSAALSPLAAIAAGGSGLSGWFRWGLIVVSAAGVGAGALVLTLPALVRIERLARYRIVRWALEHTAPRRLAVRAWGLVTMSWLLRGAALFVLLHALSLRTGASALSFALVFLCASAASTALPIAPPGAATQAGAGAGFLIATGVHASEAVAFAVAAQALVVLVGASVVISACVWHLGRRAVGLRPPAPVQQVAHELAGAQ